MPGDVLFAIGALLVAWDFGQARTALSGRGQPPPAPQLLPRQQPADNEIVRLALFKYCDPGPCKDVEAASPEIKVARMKLGEVPYAELMHRSHGQMMAITITSFVIAGGFSRGVAHTASVTNGDAAAGRQVFKKCAVCHSLEPGKTLVGPTLAGVVGRKAGSEPDYDYSPAMNQSGLVWNPGTLDSYLADPQKVVPGNTIPFPGLKTDSRPC